MVKSDFDWFSLAHFRAIWIIPEWRKYVEEPVTQKTTTFEVILIGDYDFYLQKCVIGGLIALSVACIVVLVIVYAVILSQATVTRTSSYNNGYYYNY